MIVELVASYLDHLAVERGTARNTLDSYTRDLRRYTEHMESIGVTELGAVTETQVSEFLAALRESGLAASSAARTLVAVRGLHRFAHREGVVPHDAARAVHPPSPPKRLPKALPVNDVLTLLENVGNLRDKALL